LTLYKPTFESICWVAQNMRKADADEIYPLWFDPSPEPLARAIMARPEYCWLAVHGDTPVAVFGAIEVRPKAWTAFAFGTDDFPKVAKEMTKFLVQKVKSHLFDTLGAVRVEAHSALSHRQAHHWLRFLGASSALDTDYGPNRETYLHFVMRRSDWELSQRKKASRIVVSDGGKPDLARSANMTASSHVHPLHS
jgi:hypothetical protein